MNNNLAETGPATNAREPEQMVDYKSTVIEQLKESGPLASTILAMGRAITDLESDYNNEKYYKEQYFKNWQDNSARVDSQAKVIAELREVIAKQREESAQFQKHQEQMDYDRTQMKRVIESLSTERHQLLATIKDHKKTIRKYAKARRR